MHNRLFRIASWGVTLGILNFILFVAVSLAIGGDAINGGIENGQYYLGGGGQHTQVPYLIYLYSELHAYSVFLSWPLVMILGFASWASWPQDSGFIFGIDPEEVLPRGFVRGLVARIRAAVWRSADLLEECGWFVLDSWRRPDLEFFVKYSHSECLSKLRATVTSSGQSSIPAVLAHITGRHFRLLRTPRRSTLFIYRGPYPELNGKLVPTKQGTYVRGWLRFPSTGILTSGLFLTALVGFAIAIGWVLLPPLHQAAYDPAWILLLPTSLLFAAIVGSVLSLFIGTWIGKRTCRLLLTLVREAFKRPDFTAPSGWRTGPA